MTAKNLDKIRWPPRLRPELLKRLYNSNARAIPDLELCDEVGITLYARCCAYAQTCRGDVECPVCGTVFRVSQRGESLCPQEDCDWYTTRPVYLQSLRNHYAYGGRAGAAYLTYIRQYPNAKTYRQKILLIDQLVHSFHIEEKSGRPAKSIASKLFEGNKKDVVRFLDDLSALHPEDKESWRQKVEMTIDRDIVRKYPRPERQALVIPKGGTIKATVRSYSQDSDYDSVGEFLVRTYSTIGDHINWLQPRWEYMHYHSYIREVNLSSIGVWEAGGEIVGVVHPEHSMGAVYVQVDPRNADLKRDMLAYAGEHLCSTKDGGNVLAIYINDRDDALQQVAAEMGYEKRGKGDEPMSHFVIPDPFPAINLPDGFHLRSLADDNDLQKVDRVMYRGFSHGDEPPTGGEDDRNFMQSAPNYRKDLNIVVVAPDGNFVSYCGMWYEPVHRVAYVEPVCTDPDYRRMGLGNAAVLEGIRRCGVLGATLAYVGSTQPVYLAMGFREVFNCSVWRREGIW